jgi:hypothetical protein
LQLTAAEDVAVMKRTLLVVIGAVALLAGCGGVTAPDPYASPNFSQAAQCDRDGGYWNRTASVCEMSPRH